MHKRKKEIKTQSAFLIGHRSDRHQTTTRFFKWNMFLIYNGNIRIHRDCENGIAKSVLRIAVWHHKACRVMTNGDPEGRIFLSHPHTRIMGSFSCSPLSISLLLFIFFKKGSQKFLNMLRCDMIWVEFAR